MIEYRQGTLNDLEALHSYMVQLRREAPKTLYSRAIPALSDTESFLKYHVGTSGAVAILAFQGRAIVGMIDLRRGDHPQTKHTGSFGMSVGSQHRGQGIGRKLINELEIWCKLNGISRLELEVFSNNADAVHLYESCGFQHEGKRIGAVKIEGKYEDILLMAKSSTG